MAQESVSCMIFPGEGSTREWGRPLSAKLSIPQSVPGRWDQGNGGFSHSGGFVFEVTLLQHTREIFLLF